MNKENVERLGRALAQKAAARDEFIGSAFAHWSAQHTEPLEKYLGCDANVVWRLSVTPKPVASESFVERVMKLATDLGANPTNLVRLLRWDAALNAMRDVGTGEGLLKAALDSDEV